MPLDQTMRSPGLNSVTLTGNARPGLTLTSTLIVSPGAILPSTLSTVVFQLVRTSLFPPCRRRIGNVLATVNQTLRLCKWPLFTSPSRGEVGRPAQRARRVGRCANGCRYVPGPRRPAPPGDPGTARLGAAFGSRDRRRAAHKPPGRVAPPAVVEGRRP